MSDITGIVIGIVILILFFGPADCHRGDSIAMGVVHHLEK
jgi:hypothetical protein